MTSFKVKLRLRNEFGVLESLHDADDIEVIFPYEEDSSGKIIKSLKKGTVTILNMDGEAEVEILDFDVQGMPEGLKQNFIAVVYKGSTETRYTIHKAYSIVTQVRNGETRKEFLRA